MPPRFRGCSEGPQGASGEPVMPLTIFPTNGKLSHDKPPSIERDDLILLINTPPPIWIDMVLQDIKIQIINNSSADNTNNSIKRLIWLQRIIASGKLLNEKSGGAKSDTSTYDAFSLSISALTMNIELGLDAYGRGRNFAPLLAPEVADRIITQQLLDITDIERHVEDLAAEDQDQSKKLSTLRAAAQSLKSATYQSNENIDRISTRVGELQDEISAALVSLSSIWIELYKGEAKFKAAVKAQSGCEFGEVMRFAALVTTVVASGGSALTVIGAAGTAIKELKKFNKEAMENESFSLKQVREDFKQISTAVQPIGKTVEDFRTAYSKVSPALAAATSATPPAADVPGLPSDDIKLLANKGEFDKEIAKYLNLVEAQAYKSVMDRFVSTAEMRNNKISEHDSLVAKILGVYADLVSRRSGLEQLSYTNSVNFKPGLNQNLNMLRSQLQKLKDDLARQLIDLSNSIHYATLIQPQVQLGDMSSAALKVVSASLKAQYLSAMNSLGQPPASAKNINVPLSSIMSKDLLNDFADGKTVMVSIPTDSANDPFKYWYATQTVSIILSAASGAPINSPASLWFEHQGRSLIFDASRRATVFSHAANVRGLYRIDSNGTVNSTGVLLDDSERWLGVSPYGPWRIKLFESSPAAKQAIMKASLVFGIKGRIIMI